MQGWQQRGQEDESVGDPENSRRAGKCYLLDKCSSIRVIPSQRSVQPLGFLVLLSIATSKSLNQPRNYPISAHEIPKFTPTGPDIAGMITSTGYNLIQDVSGATFGPSNRPSTDVIVDPSTNLRIASQLSGTSPQTHALLQGSPAIDRIPLDACHPNGIATDQRGVKRPQGAKCDIGAYEYVAAG